jgi:hypothetical protein
MNRIPFEPEHLLLIDDVEGKLDMDYARAGLIHKNAGPSASIVEGEEIIVCGGIHTLWKGSGEAWMALSKGHRTPSVLKFLREIFEGWLGDYTRVQALTVAGWPEGERTLEFLGFHREAILEKFGPGGIDKSLYARIQNV